MGGCANSKYAIDEEGKKKEVVNADGDNKTKSKKPFLKKLNLKNGTVKKEDAATDKAATATTTAAPTSPGSKTTKPGDENNIEFIDTEKVGATTTTTTTTKEEDNEEAKKEVTTYQTTVVKHTQKEGDELLQHLKEEAFRTLQNSLKHVATNKTTTASSADQPPQTVDESTSGQTAEELIAQVKSQVLSALNNKSKEAEIGAIIDTGVALIRDSKVKSMGELETELEKTYKSSDDLVKRVINATTGFLTAKGTEAGALLSNILANASQGIQGVMNETEKTTVKVTRTITEQVLSGGQLKEVTRIITEPVSGLANPPPANLTEILKNLTEKQVKSGTQVTQTNVQETQQHETVASNVDLKEKAEKVVTKAVEAAVEKLEADQQHQQQQQQNGYHADESLHGENIKIEEESKVTTSTTKIILNGDEANGEHLKNVQAEFYKQGKQEAEQAVKKIESGDENATPATTN